ncbi:trypsin-like isoform X2 [Dermacentor albipictus]|uniref:trypsin-like isoform X2 n=1 Tax=Dermacentor albipictus TaxID=60249 RepID=UPI0038FBFA91
MTSTSWQFRKPRVKAVSNKINSPGCGVSEPLVARIIGGTTIKRTQSPWMVQLEVNYRWNATAFISISCGGSIISPSFILTAAHCVHYVNAIPISAWAFYNTTVSGQGPYVWVEDMIHHPRFQWTTFRNDIALVKVEKPLSFDDHVRPVCLPKKRMHLEGREGMVSGWGLTAENGTASHALTYVFKRILSTKECKWFLGLPEQKKALNKDNILCAMMPGKGSCQGDSGGPLTVMSMKRRSVQVGIVSYGKGCGRSNEPGIYVRVDNYMSWIRQRMRSSRSPRWRLPTVTEMLSKYVISLG